MVIAAKAVSGPSDAWVAFRALLDARRYDEAEAACRRALEREPRAFNWRLGLTLALLGKKQYDVGLRLALTLIHDRPEHPEGYRTLALAWLALGKQATAIEWAEQAYKKSPTPEYKTFLDRLQLSTAGSDLSTPEGKLEQEVSTRERTVIVDLGTLKAAVAEAQPEGQRDLVTQILKTRGNAPAARASSLSPNAQLEAQLHRLLGASLFGVWDTSTRDIALPSPAELRKARDRSRIWTRGALALTAIGLLLLLFRAGISNKSRVEAVGEVDSLARLVEAGALTQVEPLLPRLRELLAAAGKDDAHRDLILRAEAALYRHHDADPARRAFVQRELAAGGVETPERTLARVLISSRLGRRPMEQPLTQLAASRPKDAEPQFLLATMIDARRAQKQVAEAYGKADAIEPAYLVHVAYHVENARRRGDVAEMSQLLEEMRDVQPGSPWTKLAAEMLPPEEEGEQPSPEETSTRAAAKSQLAVPPVVSAERALLQAQALEQKGDEVGADRALQKAADLVHNEAPFLIDFCDRLSETGAMRLAKQVATLPGWPRDDVEAKNLFDRLQGGAPEAPADVKAGAEDDPPKPAGKPKKKRVRRRGR